MLKIQKMYVKKVKKYCVKNKKIYCVKKVFKNCLKNISLKKFKKYVLRILLLKILVLKITPRKKALTGYSASKGALAVAKGLSPIFSY